MLYYIEKGYGTPIVLLHGNGESGEYFKNQIDFFARQYRVIAVDTRGHGKSPRGNKPFTLSQFADDLYELLISLSIDKICLLGFSDGGNIALIFTLKYLSFVEKLILNGANINPYGLNPFFLLSIRVLYGVSSVLSGFSKKAVRRKELLSLMVKEPHISPDELSAVKIPVLVIAGTHDIIKSSHTRLIADSLPSSKLCFIDGDHAVARNNSVEFNKTVENFLDE